MSYIAEATQQGAATTNGLVKETPVETPNDSRTTFTVGHEPFYINVNGTIYEAGVGLYVSYVAGTITLSQAVGTGGFIRSYYQPS